MNLYSELYKNDIADLQQMLFEEVTRYKFEVDYENFVQGFMTGIYRKRLDNGSTRIANMTWDELLCYLEHDQFDLFKNGTVDIDRLAAGWIGRIYSLVQSKTQKASSELYQIFPYKKMKCLFSPLHTVSEEVAVDKLIKMM